MLPFNPKSSKQTEDVPEESTEKNIYTWDTREMEKIVYFESSRFESVWFNHAFETRK
jgi:hypothetical protein